MAGRNEPLVEGVDYYIEDGRWVFTEKFLRDRGHCCASGCRHCPYGYRKGEENEASGPREGAVDASRSQSQQPPHGGRSPY